MSKRSGHVRVAGDGRQLEEAYTGAVRSVSVHSLFLRTRSLNYRSCTRKLGHVLAGTFTLGIHKELKRICWFCRASSQLFWEKEAARVLTMLRHSTTKQCSGTTPVQFTERHFSTPYADILRICPTKGADAAGGMLKVV
jgi:hypothetical protein